MEKNEVSIIINGVRYDSFRDETVKRCDDCELPCEKVSEHFPAWCGNLIGMDSVFKKSTKNFER